MNRRTGILIGITLISLIGLIFTSMSNTIAENQTPEQSTSTTISSDTSSSSSTNYASTTVITTDVGSFSTGLSLILVLVALLFSPVLGIFLLLLGQSSFGGVASGFEAVSILPILLVISLFLILTRRRKQN